MATICDGKECEEGRLMPDWDALYLAKWLLIGLGEPRTRQSRYSFSLLKCLLNCIQTLAGPGCLRRAVRGSGLRVCGSSVGSLPARRFARVCPEVDYKPFMGNSAQAFPTSPEGLPASGDPPPYEGKKSKRSSDNAGTESPAESAPRAGEKDPAGLLSGRAGAWTCCPFPCPGPGVYQPPGTLPPSPFPGLGLWRKSAAALPAEGPHFCKEADSTEQKLYRPVVLKPIPTKPTVPPPIFNVFGYL
ncbi:PREDICTED: protein FAM181A [Tauraco erythrolophus]|uniref:protein FAM181A n=1 Tax=Tauraco erythrolophus TaxID=121530 RepID=UPI000523B662|nr:PREDICTED: protein FAM181A [Tauraco erythrolophus]